MSEIKPWSRQVGETSKAYEAFEAYRDLGAQRSTAAVARSLSKSKTLMDRWSGQHNWVARVQAWDSVPSEAVANAYQEMAADIAAQHRALSDKLMDKLSKNLDLLPEGADPTIRWSTAHGAARQGHALATDLVKPASTATDEINKAIENLLNKLAGE